MESLSAISGMRTVRRIDSCDEALGVVKAAFSAVSTKHLSTRAREAIDALIETGKLQQAESCMLSIGS